MAMTYIIPWLQKYFIDENIYILLIVGTVLTVTLLFNLIMWFIYIKKIPFFEQYRCNPNVLFQ